MEGGKWKGVSDQGKEFVSRTDFHLREIVLLQKDATKRPPLKELLMHPWIVHDTPDLGKLRREAKREQEFRLFSLANPGTMKIFDDVKKKTQELTNP
jgi:hypothetical protein